MTQTTSQTETKRQAPRNFFDLTQEEYDELRRRFDAKRAAKFQKFLSQYGYDLEKCEFKQE